MKEELLEQIEEKEYVVYNSKNKQQKLVITQRSIKIGNQEVDYENTIGLIKQGIADQLYSAYSLYSFVKKDTNVKQSKRELKQLRFRVKESQSWPSVQNSIISRITNRKEGESKKVLICFNPNAGSNSRKHLNNILNFISRTNLTYELFTTQYRNHCLQMLKKVDVRKYCGVAIVSGDGLMHEFVNSFCQLPVTHVPAGSGNAFAKTQMQIAGQHCNDQNSIFLVVKNRLKDFNIIRYDLEKEKEPIYSFLSLEWAFIADIDLNSQFLRCMGGLRFQVYAVWRVLKMKRYRGKISYSVNQSDLPPLNVPITQNDPNFGILNDTFLHAMFCSIPYISDKYKIAPMINIQERLFDFQYLVQRNGRGQLIKYLLSSDSGTHFNHETKEPRQGYNFTYKKIKSFRLEPLNPDQMGIFGIDGEAYDAQKIQGTFDQRVFKSFI